MSFIFIVFVSLHSSKAKTGARQNQQLQPSSCYRMSVHLSHLHWCFSTEVIDSDHVISAASSHEHSTYAQQTEHKVQEQEQIYITSCNFF